MTMPITQSELASDPFSGEDGDIAGIYDPARAYGLRMG
jgi:hypothetical protein